MQFNNTSKKESSLYHDTLQRAGIDEGNVTDLPITVFTRSANKWYRKTAEWIWQATGSWEWDDSNHNSIPVTSTDLVDLKQTYSFPTGMERLLRLEAKDNNGNWIQLKQFDQSERRGTALSEYLKAEGMPREYDIMGSFVLLYPKVKASRVTLTKGLKWYISRDIVAYTSSSTVVEPGFVKAFHPILSIGSALDFCRGEGKTDRIAQLQQELTEVKEALFNYYGSRNEDKKLKLIPHIEGNRDSI